MQVTLVQSEIEQALRDFIHSQISVKEGMEIVIVLKATRGDEGTTAIIDIVKPEAGTAIVAAAANVAKPAVTRTVTASKNEVVKETPKAAVVKETPVVEEPEAKEVPVVVDEPVVEEVKETVSTQVGGAEDEPAPERPVNKAASLFSGLQKPKNS